MGHSADHQPPEVVATSVACIEGPCLQEKQCKIDYATSIALGKTLNRVFEVTKLDIAATSSTLLCQPSLGFGTPVRSAFYVSSK